MDKRLVLKLNLHTGPSAVGPKEAIAQWFQPSVLITSEWIVNDGRALIFSHSAESTRTSSAANVISWMKVGRYYNLPWGQNVYNGRYRLVSLPNEYTRYGLNTKVGSC